MNTPVWIVITEDRHADVEADPFSTEQAAVDYAREAAAENAGVHLEVTEAQISQRARDDGWVLVLEYGSEGDCVRVVRREMDATP
jgi:hypothetical protein